MAVNDIKNNSGYGLGQGLLIIPQKAINSKRSPTTADKAQPGTIWVNRVLNEAFVLTSIIANSASWLSLGAGAGVFNSVTATTGDITADQGDVIVTQGNIVVDQGNITATIGTITAGGGFVSGGNFAVTGNFTQTGGTFDAGTDATGNAINIGTGAAGKAISIGNVTGNTALFLDSGTNGITMTSTGAGDIVANAGDALTLNAAGIIAINSSAAVINVGNNAVAQNINVGTGAAERTITVGNATAATSVVVNVGTGNLDLGVTATAHTTRLGSTNTTSTTTIQGGTGGIALNAGGLVAVAPSITAPVASPGDTAVNDARVGGVSFTGFTTAAAGSQTFTITNALVTDASNILVTVSNTGANDAQMTLSRVFPAAGEFDVVTVNNGAAALNGTVLITFWVLN